MKDLIINGVPLRDPLGGKYGIDYTASTFLSDAQRMVSGGGSVYGFHGDLPETENWFGTSRETLTLNVMGDDNTEHNALLNAFHGMFTAKDFDVVAAPQRSPLAVGSGRNGRTFNVDANLLKIAKVRGIGSPALERLNERTARMTVILEKIYGFWSSQNEYTTALIPITAASQEVDLTSDLAGSNAPIIDGKIRIKGPLSAATGQVVVYDKGTTRGLGIKVIPALTASQYVIIDMLTMKASMVTSDTWTGGTDFSARVVITGDGQFSLDHKESFAFPTSFSYGATVVSAGYTSGSTAVQFRLRRSFL